MCSRASGTLTAWASCTVLSLVVSSAPAKDNSLGRLIFLGKTSDSSRSVWLSINNAAGSFELQTQGQQVVDEWVRAGAGRRLTLSPFVSTGSGGTHFLLEVSGDKPVQIDSQNQKGGFVFPSDLGPRRPNGYFPLPDIPQRHPTGYIPLPDIPQRHPTGYIPLPDIPQRHPTGYIPLPDIPQRHPTGYIPLPPLPPRPPRPPQPPDGGGGHPDGYIPIPDRPVGPSTPDFASSGPGYREMRQEEGFGSHVPSTRGREFAVETYWNLWIDSRFHGTSDERKGLDIDGRGVTVTVGADRRLSERVVFGLMTEFDDFSSSAFEDLLNSDSVGFTVGPYLSYQLTSTWVLEASLGYGRAENANSLFVLDSEFTTENYTGSLSAVAQYPVGAFNVRPRICVSYTRSRSEAHEMKGEIGRFDIELPQGANSFDSGMGEVTVEVNRVFRTSATSAFVPYVELGVHYDFIRPDDGRILTGDFTRESVPAWRGTVRVGARALVSQSAFIEGSVGYLSVGQRDLDLWEGRLFLSYAF